MTSTTSANPDTTTTTSSSTNPSPSSDSSSNLSSVGGSDESKVTLVQAQVKDFYQGAEIYVRGILCTCLRYDSPLVYYRFSHQPLSIEKHRSFITDRIMFTVNPLIQQQHNHQQNNKQRYGIMNQVIYQDIQHQLDDEEREGHGTQDVVYEINENAEETDETETDTQQETETETPTRTFPPPDQAKSNLLGAFLNRPKKTIFENLSGEQISCPARFPSSVLISACTDSTFTLTDKVSSITILNCTNVSINFQSVIGSFEIIKSSGCHVVCQGLATTYQCDQATDCDIYFPTSSISESEALYWVTSHTSGLYVVAVADITVIDATKTREQNVTSKDHIYQIREISDDTTQTVTTATATTTESDAERDRSAVQPQWKTVFTNGDFTTTPLQREGIGYVKP